MPYLGVDKIREHNTEGGVLCLKKPFLFLAQRQSEDLVHLLNDTKTVRSVVSALKSFQNHMMPSSKCSHKQLLLVEEDWEKSYFLFWGFGSLIQKRYSVPFWWFDRGRIKVISTLSSFLLFSVLVAMGKERHFWRLNYLTSVYVDVESYTHWFRKYITDENRKSSCFMGHGLLYVS